MDDNVHRRHRDCRYRSFGETVQYIRPCRKINLIIGQNNSGKSNILSFIKHYYAEALKAAKSTAQLNFQPLDRHVISGGQMQTEGFAYAPPVGGEEYGKILARMLQQVDRGGIRRAFPHTSLLSVWR